VKTEQLNVIAKTYDDEQAQTSTKSSSTGTKSPSKAKTKYDDVNAKLDQSEELSTNRSAQLDNMHAVLFERYSQ
jgi:hypothetical protein